MERMTLPIMLKIKIIIIIINKIKLGNKECPDSEIIISYYFPNFYTPKIKSFHKLGKKIKTTHHLLRRKTNDSHSLIFQTTKQAHFFSNLSWQTNRASPTTNPLKCSTARSRKNAKNCLKLIHNKRKNKSGKNEYFLAEKHEPFHRDRSSPYQRKRSRWILPWP
jgi:hypothetical protein